MNDTITIEGVKYIRADKVIPAKKNHKGLEYCIVRTYSAGVFAGYFDRSTKGQEGKVYQARRLWYWDGANSLSELALHGVAKPQNCKFPEELPEVDLKQIVEVILCTEKAKKSIASVEVWKQ